LKSLEDSQLSEFQTQFPGLNWKTLRCQHLEKHLSESDWLEHMGCSSDRFETIPPWKQVFLRQRAKLF
jgi:hypothetical protein